MQGDDAGPAPPVPCWGYEGRGRQLAPSLEVLDDDGLRREYLPGLGLSPDHRFLLGADERTAGLLAVSDPYNAGWVLEGR
ncbi:hypothetical protein [Kitasatospora herbaricolor]|uniref:Uncharacterized protein n=1 Tax=Kitasatospora herbaricolor TaxID=68217 RepID=A0ABZ1WI39_9ACTN|nr:hypothetical protein [Kitasatospora herbaricolor]